MDTPEAGKSNKPSDDEAANKAQDANEKEPGQDEAASSDVAKAKTELHQHHVSKILDEVLDEAPTLATAKRFKHPMFLDLILAFGLLITMGGFAIGLFKMYLTHSAEQSITQQNYKAAIAILKGSPFPGFFSVPGSDPDELLSQALYLDAMEKVDVNNDIQGAIRQLQQIRPGSRYFILAQDFIKENWSPATTILEGGAAESIEVTPEGTNSDSGTQEPASSTGTPPGAAPDQEAGSDNTIPEKTAPAKETATDTIQKAAPSN